ncbi:MAG: CDP-glycerol glycerophosphotransferase family protein [Patescibacteria group bacterium]
MTRIFGFLTDWTYSFLSHLTPRNKNLWVFWGWHLGEVGELFADNSKYFYLYINNHHKEIRAVWLTGSSETKKRLQAKGLECYLFYEYKGALSAMLAGFTIIDGLMSRSTWRYAGRTNIIQLWHGKGMKKGLHLSPYNNSKKNNYFITPQLFKRPTKIIASSAYAGKLMALMFNEPMTKIITTGLPRNDVLFKTIKNSEVDTDLELKESILKVKQVCKGLVLYAPTFRPDGKNPLDAIDWEALNSDIKEANIYITVLLHPKFARKTHSKMESFSNIIYGKPGFDIYPLLINFDALITDYSSIYIDYLLLDRPMIFFDFDIEEYKQKMGLFDEYAEMTPGPHPKDQKDLTVAIKEVIKNDTFKSERQRVMKLLHEHTLDGNSSERVLSGIKGL